MIKAETKDKTAWIEEAKRRRKLNEPGIPAEKFNVFRKLLAQRIQETGALEREYAEQLLQKLQRGEL